MEGMRVSFGHWMQEEKGGERLENKRFAAFLSEVETSRRAGCPSKGGREDV
jgi:hypothetical protein